jgi:hypothetical protein
VTRLVAQLGGQANFRLNSVNWDANATLLKEIHLLDHLYLLNRSVSFPLSSRSLQGVAEYVHVA